jgi:hypothetical protein
MTTSTEQSQTTTATMKLKARERVFNSPTGLGATSGGYAHAHPPEELKAKSTPNPLDRA